ncbi:MAG TPA: FAD-dependent oxidoreductase [Candidatus Angelobacter sp.]|nr:FAD-dependent oxidoreductase [Candidatus Angelobacter sp.]
MPESRRQYLTRHRSARAWAALDRATNAKMKVAYDPSTLKRDSLNGKHVVIVGSGVGGLTTAYELLANNSDVKVTVLEARDRTGGRCLTLRTGDTLTEDKNSDLHSSPGETQVVRFEHPVGDSEPYLNAGPGRIPSSHKLLLDYLRRFGVPVEIYVMASESNMTQMQGGPEGLKPVVNRQLTHNTRGWIAEMVYKNAAQLLGASTKNKSRVEQLQSLMVTFGDLDQHGNYVVGTADPGQDDTEDVSDRAGFTELPGVGPGKIAPAIDLDRLLESEYWEKTRFYQPVDFLWQPTLFQPVGGMDQVQHAFSQQVAMLGGVVHLNSPVTNIDYDGKNSQFLISAEGHEERFRADYCFCNLAIPFLKGILSERLQALGGTGGFSEEFKQALHAVYDTQDNENEIERFLAYTTKVGWQADRSLWQGKPFQTRTEKGMLVKTFDESELGVVPIYGGISWTDNPITQIWYPSNAYHDRKGVLTGAYNFSENAKDFGDMTVQQRLDEARKGAALFGAEFAAGLDRGIAIAWQNMAHIKGGWAQWNYVEDSVDHYNHIIQGTGVDGASNPSFFIVGDQVSSLPGWQEGAIASALNAISRLARPDLMLPFLSVLPDTKLMVEGL